MKQIIVVIFLICLLACQSDKKKSPQAPDFDLHSSDLYEPLESEASSEDQNYQAALDFLNSYVENSQHLEILEFVKSSPLATESLKVELEKILIKAWEDDPQVGLGFDPLFDAQDFPDKGVELHSFDPGTGYVIVKGIDWPEFRVAMKVVNENGHILVDGCGVVNIPESQQAER